MRDQKKFAFIEVNDGSSLTGIQVVAEASIDTYADVLKLTTGAAVEICGYSLNLHVSSGSYQS